MKKKNHIEQNSSGCEKRIEGIQAAADSQEGVSKYIYHYLDSLFC